MNTSVTVDDLLEQIASDAPTPGGGAVGSYIVALGCAQALMVVNIRLRNKAIVNDPEKTGLLEEYRAKLENIRDAALRNWDNDEKAYAAVCSAQALPKESEGRAQALEEALIKATFPGMHAIQLTDQALQCLKLVFDLTNKGLYSDIACAAAQLRAAAECSWATILANVAYIKHRNSRDYIYNSVKGDILEAKTLSSAILRAVEIELEPKD